MIKLATITVGVASMLAVPHPALAQASSPAAPTGLSVSGGGNPGELDVSWDAHPDGATEYRLSWAPANGDFQTWTDTNWNAFLTGTSYTITGLDGGAEYKARVRARFQGGTSSSWSGNSTGMATASTESTSVPATPSRPTVDSVAHNSVTISWSDPSDSTITSYQVLRRNPALHAVGQFVVIEDDTGSSNTSYTDTTVDPETRYVYRVKARNANGLSDRSGYVNATTPAAPVLTPATPSRPTVDSIAHDSVTISWSDPGDSGITGYQILRRNPAIHDSGVFVTIEDDTGSSVTSYTDTTVAPETTYRYRVKARNAHGLSEWSEPAARFTTPADPTPSNESPTGLPIITGTEQVGETLSADTSGISDGNGLTGVSYTYQWIRSDGGSDSNIPGATGQTYTLTDDDQGKTIKVEVSFIDDDGYAESLTGSATGSIARPANEAPTGLPIIIGAAYIDGTLSVNTSGISDGNGLTGVSYTYQWIRVDGSSDTNITDATGRTYTLTDDDNEKTIKVKVSFTDDDGYSESLTSAETVSVTTLTPLSTPDPLTPLPQQQAPSASVSEGSGQDLPADNTTTGWVIVGDGGATGNLGASDTDAFKINLVSGKRYRIDVLGKGPRDHANGGTYLGELELMVRTLQNGIGTSFVRLNGFGTKSPSDTTINNAVNKAGGPDLGARSEFNVTATNTYMIKVTSDGSNTGTYTVKASEITSEQAFGDFTSQWNSGRIQVDDTAAMTGRIASSGDNDWYVVGLEAGKCYSIQVRGRHSDSAHDGGTLNDPKLKVMNFYDYYHRDFYDPNTLAFVGIPANERDVAYYDMTYINPDNFVLLNQADKICNMVSPSDQPGSSKLICNYYCDDDSGPGNNSLIKVRVKTGGASDYVIGVEGQGSTGTYSVYVKEIDCPSN